MKPRPITIIVPVYNGWGYLERCIASLRRFAKNADKILLINDASPERTIESRILNVIKGEKQFYYFKNETNIGFIRTCNRGVFELDKTTNDILLLNSDTEVTKGFLEEMSGCLYDFEKNAVCSPRSNNATIMTIPPFFSGDRKDFAKLSYTCWKTLAPKYRRYDIVPTAVGFCMLIRRQVIENFGLFDEAYGRGYNEENDFCSRINRYGYSIIRSNHAFVYHHESRSFGREKKKLEERNRKLLTKTWPEYFPAVNNYCDWRRDAIDHFADILGRCYKRKRILYDLMRLQPLYNGTNEQAIHTLQEAYPILSKKYDVVITINKRADKFLGISSRFPSVLVDDAIKSEMHFDLAFVPHQIFEYTQLFKLNKMATRIVVNVLDIISLRSNYLHEVSCHNLFRHTMQWSDGILSISNYSMDDYENYYGKEIFRRYVEEAHPVLISKTDRSRTKVFDRSPSVPEDFILILGNKFHHKAILRALKEIDSQYPVIIVGDLPSDGIKQNICVYRSGNLSEEFVETLYRRCKMVVFPSQYEGFGLPVLNAFIYGKPVVMFRSAVNEELVKSFHHKNKLFFIDLFSELPPVLKHIYSMKDESTSRAISLNRTWEDVGRETASVLDTIVSKEIDLNRLQDRFFELKALEHYGALCGIMGSARGHTVSGATAKLIAVEASLSYRVGRAITYPVRMIYDALAVHLLSWMGRSSFGVFRSLHVWGTDVLHKK